MTHSQDFSLYFGKQSDEIDASTLADSLSSFSTLVDEINRTLETGKALEFKIKAFRSGSFEVPCEMIEVAIAGFLSSPETNHLPTILKIAWEMFKLKLNLGGKPPREVRTEDDSTAIVTESGNVTHVDNRTYYIFKNNTIAVNALEKQFEALARDREITDFKLLVPNEKAPLIDIPSEQFPILAEKLQLKDEDKKSLIDKTKLNLLKAVFDNRYKWEFYREGVKIAAFIRDENFLERIASGERFGKGDILVAELQINQVFDSTLNTFINRSYEVLKVVEHIPRPEQPGLGI